MLEELIKSVLKRYSKTKNFEGEVLSVDEVKETCVVKPVDGPELLGVRLKSIIGNTATKLVIVPKVGSYVTVSVLNNIDTETYVTQFSEVEKIITNCDQVIYNGGNKGGLVNWPDAKVQLDKTNEVLQVIVDSLKNWVPVASDGGAALKTYFNTQLGVKTKGNFDNLEDQRVKH